MLIIFVQSSIGSLKLPDFEFDFSDKVIHFLVFGVLGILMARGLRIARNKIIQEKYVMFTLVICIIYGASDEVHQYFVPGRHFSIGDWIADILGVITMVWIYKLYIESKELKDKKTGEDRPVV